MLWRVSFAVTIHDTVRTARTRTATGMPYGCTLQIHFLSIAERIATLGATSTGRMKVVIVSGL